MPQAAIERRIIKLFGVNLAETKRCTRCGKRKPVSEFSKRTDRIGGLRCWCRECRTEEARVRRDARLVVEMRNDLKDARENAMMWKDRATRLFAKLNAEKQKVPGAGGK